jgi:hypothetical protein
MPVERPRDREHHTHDDVGSAAHNGHGRIASAVEVAPGPPGDGSDYPTKVVYGPLGITLWASGCGGQDWW